MGGIQRSSAQIAKWDWQSGEPTKAFATFRCYRNLHPLDRSLAEVGRKLGVSKKYLERLSVKFQWVDRTAAFDRAQDEIDIAQRARRIREMNDSHAEIAATALRKVSERLETIDTDTLRPADLARLLEIASRVERMARGVLQDEPEVHQSRVVFRADDIRAKLKAEGLLNEDGTLALAVSG